MLNIIFFSLKKQFRGAVYYFIALFLYVWMLAAMFPTMAKVDMAQMYGSFPKEFLKFFGGEDIQAMSTFEGFLSMEFLSLFFILIIAFFASASAGSIIAGMIEKRTMDFHLSQPISRTKHVLFELIVSLKYIFGLVLLNSLSILMFAKIYDIKINNDGLIALTITATFLLWTVFSFALFLSSMLRAKITVISITLSATMAFYILTAMSKIVDKMKNFDKFSIFYTYNPQKLLQSGDINWLYILILATISIFFIFSAIIIFNKKDI